MLIRNMKPFPGQRGVLAPALEKADKREEFPFLCAAQNPISIWPEVPSRSTGDEFGAASVYTVNNQPSPARRENLCFTLEEVFNSSSTRFFRCSLG